MISFSRVLIGDGGIPVCSRCGVRRNATFRPSDAVLRGVRDVVSSWPGGPGPNVWLAGADGFAHPELPKLLADAVGAGVERLKVSTAGPALAQGGNAPGSIEAGLRHVEVVVLSVDQVADDATCTPAFGDVLAGIAAYLDAAATLGERVALVARVLVCAHTRAAAPTTVAALAAAGATQVTVDLGSDCENRVGDPDPSWMRAVVDSGVVNRSWVAFEGLAEGRLSREASRGAVAFPSAFQAIEGRS